MSKLIQKSKNLTSSVRSRLEAILNNTEFYHALTNFDKTLVCALFSQCYDKLSVLEVDTDPSFLACQDFSSSIENFRSKGQLLNYEYLALSGAQSQIEGLEHASKHEIVPDDSARLKKIIEWTKIVISKLEARHIFLLMMLLP